MIRLKKCSKNAWLMTKDEENVGLLNKKIDDSYSMIYDSQRTTFKDKNELLAFFNHDIFKAPMQVIKEEKKVSFVKGFPVNVTDVYSVDESLVKKYSKLPLFTKSEKSNVVFAAGHFCVKCPMGWLKSFCPKLSTLEKYEYIGPFKDKTEMRSVFSKLRKDEKSKSTAH